MRKGQYEVFTFSRKHICVSLDDSTLKKSTRTSPNPATVQYASTISDFFPIF